jgi:hypothetical protein
MGGTEDRLGWKRLAVVGDLNPARTLEAVLFEKPVLADLLELVYGFDDRRAIGEITQSH